jgi:CRP/FNR family transcriptional regulator, cyclic AMP receptor protein
VNELHQFDENSFFYLLDENERNLLKERMREEHFPMGKYVFRENDSAERLYIVEKGAVSLIKSLGDDMHKTILIAPEGSIFGEFGFMDGGARSASALASDDTILLGLDRKDFDALNRKFPEIGTKVYNNLLRTVTQRIRKTTEAHWRTIENVIKNEKWINPDVG